LRFFPSSQVGEGFFKKIQDAGNKILERDKLKEFEK
jgi:hypothetical protein